MTKSLSSPNFNIFLNNFLVKLTLKSGLTSDFVIRCEKNNEQRLKLFVVAAFGICRHHRFVHETNVVHPYRILGASTSKSDTSLKNQGTGLCLRFHTPREV